MDSERKFGSKIYKVKIIIMIIITIIVLILVIVSSLNYGTKRYLSSFSREKWLNYPEKRYLMVDDLLENGQLSGLTKADVYNLLGSENMVETDNKRLLFSLGGEFFSEMLLVEFDDSEKVTKTVKYID